MPNDGRDYGYSINRNILTFFRDKYFRDAVDFMKELIKETETIPCKEIDLYLYAQKIIDEAMGTKYKDNLIKAVVKSIKDAPRKTDDSVY